MRLCLTQVPGLKRQFGSGYTEMLLAVTISALLMAGLMGVVSTATDTGDEVRQRNDLTRQARFAMQSMVSMVSRSRRLMLPLNNSIYTDWPDNIREQTVPASPPTGSSILDSAVLAVTLPADVDLDGNGFPDADNDADGRIDEDWPGDVTNDRAAGIYQIDDMGDGTVDKFSACCFEDDEEDFGIQNEDPVNGIDDDADGLTDEDPWGDMNADFCPGICGIDDDEDGSIDEGSDLDDDEDGLNDEDWLDSVVFYLSGSTLRQRHPVPWDTDGDSDVDGRDFIVSDLAENITRFRVERLDSAGVGELIDLILELTDPVTGDSISLQTRVRVGGAL